MSYPACEISRDYPVLIAVPVEQRAAMVERARRGEGISTEEAQALGLSPSMAGMVLISFTVPRTDAQLRAISVADDFLDGILRLGMKEVKQEAA